jgi:quinol monooxygenase YgiN
LKVIIAGTFEVDAKDREQFVAERESQVRRSRAEDGCIAYAFTTDPIDEGCVRLFECWETNEALVAHQAALQASPAPATTPIRSMRIFRFDVSDMRLISK